MFRVHVWIISIIRVQVKIFVQKPWKSRTILNQEKSGCPTSSMREGKLFLEEPNDHIPVTMIRRVQGASWKMDGEVVQDVLRTPVMNELKACKLN